MGEYRDGHRGGGDYEKRYDPRPPLPTRSMMGGRIYIGKLPSDIREKEIEKVFGKFGKITEIALKGNYCFVQYETSRASKDAVYEMNDRTAFGDRIQVEHARTPKEFGFKAPRGGYGGGYRGYSGSRGGYGGGGYNSYRGSNRDRRRSPPIRSDYRLAVTNLSTRCDGQDLKAVMEKAGEVYYSDAHRRRVGEGVVEFASRKDMERALKKLDGLEINGKPIKLEIEEVRKPRRSRSASHSRSRSKTRSRSRSDSKRKHSTSRSLSAERSDDERSVKSKEGKSDDEEFEEAERSVKRRKQEKGSESDSEHDYDVVDDHNGSDKGEAEYSGTSSQVKQEDGEGDEEQKSGEDNTADDDDEIEEVEEIVEEVVEEEVEVDDDDETQSNEEFQGENDDEPNADDDGGTLLNGDSVADY